MKEFSEIRGIVGGVRGVMQRLGDAPPDGRWNPMTYCPFCQASKTASVYNKGGVDYFICHQKPGQKHSGCCTGNRSLTETSYISMKLGLSETKPSEGGPSPAYRRLLELAGCWEEPKSQAPSTKDQAPKVEASPAPPENGTNGKNGTDEKSAPPSDVPAAPALPGMETAAGPSDEALMLMKCIEVIRVENKASVRLLQKHLKLGFARATRLMEELEKRGIVGDERPNEPREILKLPDRPAGVICVKLDDEITIEFTDGSTAQGQDKEAAPLPGPTPGVAPLPIGSPVPQSQRGEDVRAADESKSPKLPLGLPSLRWFYNRLTPTEEEMVAYLPATTAGAKQPVPSPLPKEVARRLKYAPVPIFFRRGITSISCAAVGLRANPPANEGLLREMETQFVWDEIRASGAWLESDRKRNLGRRPDAQFHGKGQAGKKPKNERKGKDDKWVWGFCEPVLIPYFDEAGDLQKLRPHKGGARGGTMAGRPLIYVPRDYRNCADVVEKFYTVVICEGEYKAIAIWQTLGRGALLQEAADGTKLVDPARFEPVGVCALPGISYVTNIEMRMDLERWLGDVGARRIIVAFDDEDKSGEPLRQRFDAQRDMRVLAIELSAALHLDARVCVLPKEWRNAKGKADWDGALAGMVQP